MAGMKRIVCLFIVIFLSISMLGCRSNGNGKENDVEKEWKKFYKLNLDGAKAVVRWPTTINGNIVGKLFKITKDNKFVPVDPLDNQGEKVDILFMPSSMFNASPDYLIAWVSNDRGGDAPGVYLIRKEDGRIYRIPPEAGFPAYYLRGRNWNRGYTVQSDAAGNLYYITGTDGKGKSEQVVKLTIGSGVTAKIISRKSDENIYHFWVDRNGNVMYNYTYLNYFRLVNTDGVPRKIFEGIYDYEDKKQAANCFVADGEIYLIGGKGEGVTGFQNWVIDKITVDAGGNVSLTEYKSGFDPEADEFGGFIYDCLEHVHHEVNLQGHVFYIYNDSLIMTEVYNPSDSREIPSCFNLFSHFTNIYDYDHTDNELYLFGKDKTGEPSIVRFHPVSGEFEPYQRTSDYYFSSPPHHEKSFIALGNGEFLLEGRRRSDDRRVLLIADSSGFHEIEEMDPEYDTVMICFERFPFHVE